MEPSLGWTRHLLALQPAKQYSGSDLQAYGFEQTLILATLKYVYSTTNKQHSTGIDICQPVNRLSGLPPLPPKMI
jgi:hypothetical protein